MKLTLVFTLLFVLVATTTGIPRVRLKKTKLPKCFICTLELDPICGKDGVNYGNLCELECSGAEVAHYGYCKDKKAKKVQQYRKFKPYNTF